MTTAVYKVSGDATSSVYYGYAVAGTEASTFFAGCNRVDNATRGDRRMLDANGGDVDSLVFEVVAELDDEFEAWCMRNDLRSSDAASITGPTMFPTTAATRVAAEQPSRVATWKRHSNYKTAREAYEAGAYTMGQITAACSEFGRDVIRAAMVKMTPAAFESQFNVVLPT